MKFLKYVNNPKQLSFQLHYILIISTVHVKPHFASFSSKYYVQNYSLVRMGNVLHIQAPQTTPYIKLLALHLLLLYVTSFTCPLLLLQFLFSSFFLITFLLHYLFNWLNLKKKIHYNIHQGASKL